MNNIIYLVLMEPDIEKENKIIELKLYEGNDLKRINLYENIDNKEKHGYDKNDITLNEPVYYKDLIQYFTDDFAEAEAISKGFSIFKNQIRKQKDILNERSM